MGFYSHDGGQHWKEEIVPNLTAGLAGGDPAVVYDPKDHVFVYSFIQFSRTDSTNTINVTSSSDGVSWSFPLTLDAHAGMDKPMITVDRNLASPHYGRLLVAWRDDTVGQNALIDAFSDNGGGSWMGSSNTINTVPDCGNGASPAFDANGEAMVAWFDCNGGTRIEEGLSTDGGASWRQPNNTVISGVTDIGSNGPSGACSLNFGGSSFRCNSFPSLAGDPNPLDAGGRAFFVVFANWEPTTQGGITANVSQLHGLSTVDGGGTWNGGAGFGFNYMAFRNFGDKFFPWASFSPNGRLNVGYSDREADASATNPNGLSYNEGQAEASSLTSLRSNSYIAYTVDGTLGNPGSLSFIGDYSGIESQDNDFDTFPVWTDVRNGVVDVRTMDLCYIDCPTFLQPETPSLALHAPGSSFLDLYQFNTDFSFRRGGDRAVERRRDQGGRMARASMTTLAWRAAGTSRRWSPAAISPRPVMITSWRTTTPGTGLPSPTSSTCKTPPRRGLLHRGVGQRPCQPWRDPLRQHGCEQCHPRLQMADSTGTTYHWACAQPLATPPATVSRST